jgi:hypothetical protein
MLFSLVSTHNPHQLDLARRCFFTWLQGAILINLTFIFWFGNAFDLISTHNSYQFDFLHFGLEVLFSLISTYNSYQFDFYILAWKCFLT